MIRAVEKLRSLVANRSGVAAIEFAFIAPALIIGIMVVTDLSKMLADRTDMQSAARAGLQYLMNGGRDEEAVRDIVLAAWSTKPVDGNVITERYCLCAELVHACDSLCPNQTTPEIYTRVKLVGTLSGLWGNTYQTADEAVRLR